MPARLAVNLASYRAYRAGALEHIASLGLRWVELPIPAPGEREALREQLARCGLAVSSLTCPVDLEAPPELLHERLEAGRLLGASLFFTSPRVGTLPRVETYRRLRACCDVAEAVGATFCLETHPPLAQNATEARATLVAVAHPSLRWNLDTANLYFYNHNLDAVTETERGLELIASVHLKDTNGGHGAWWFPALGEGVVDLPGVLRRLAAGGFDGPLTLELEGIEGEALDEAGVRERVAQSVCYLESLPAFRALTQCEHPAGT